MDMFNARFFRVYRMILCAVLVVILLPTLALCVYDRPQSDDLQQPRPVAAAWRETGSLGKTFLAAVQATRDIYFDYSGIFFSMLLMVFPFSVFHYTLIGLNAALAVVLLVGAMFRLAFCARDLCPDAPGEAVHCLGLLMAIFVLLLMPSYYEGIYWATSAINYACIVAMSVFLFASVCHGLCTGCIPVWKLALWCVGFFCLGGSNWQSSTSSIVIYGLLALGVLLLRKPKRLLLPFAFLLAGYLVAVCAPGNFARQDHMGVEKALVSTLVYSLSQGGRFFFSDVRFWLFVPLYLPVLAALCRHSRLSFRYPLLVTAASVCVMGSAMFPLYYLSSYWAARHTNTCFMLLSMLLPINLFYWCGWLMCRIKLPTVRPAAFGAAALACLLALGGQSFTEPKPSGCTLGPVQAAITLVDGTAHYYAQWYDDLVEDFQSRPGEDVVISYQVENRLLSPYGTLTDDPAWWENEAFAGFYGNGNTAAYRP